jgi:hypothetical protein
MKKTLLLVEDSKVQKLASEKVIVVSHLPPTNSAQLKAAGAADHLEKSSLEDYEGEAVFLGTIKRVLRESEERNEEGTHMPLVARQ